MKQHITKEQWDELDVKQKKVYVFKVIDSINNDKDFKGFEWKEGRYPNISQMIEFLGDDFWSTTITEDRKEWIINPYDLSPMNEATGRQYINTLKPELADALWEACKEKLDKI